MKKNSLVKTLVLASVMCCSLAGCGGGKLQLVEIDPYTLGANYRNLRINGGYASAEQFTEHTRFDEEHERIDTTYIIEDVKALVVPVDFTDYPSSVYGDEDYSREILRKVMFGGEGDTDWYSLAGYYKSSSFGKCNISGTVAPWWHTGKRAGYKDSSGTYHDYDIDPSNTGFATQIATNIVDYYQNHSSEINLADYDANKDGLVDSIIMVYSAPIDTTGTVWWAFCSSVPGAIGKYTKDGSMEGANRYFWASFNFLFEKNGGGYYTNEEIKSGTVKPDAHTMTHEYGHVLSLPDYYITDYNKKDYSGLGALDMMDYNVGDHNAFSKMLYGWINPRRVEGKSGKVTVTLNSTTRTGDTILIPAPGEWNDTYLDQYVLIEFLTPEGVAEKDGKEKYLGTYPKYYSKAGIRILHVDARLGTRAWSTGTFTGYTGSTKKTDDYYVTFAADNTASDSCFKDYKLIEIVPKGKELQSERRKNANDDCLYYEGESFNNSKFKFNGVTGEHDKKFGYKIHIDRIDGNNSATITISR